MSNFIEKFELAFAGIVAKYGFEVRRASDSDVFLCKKDFALRIYCELDGVGVRYLRRELETGKLLQYALGHFLVRNRKWVPSYKSEMIAAELEAYAMTLDQSASDILRGGRRLACPRANLFLSRPGRYP